MDPAIQKILTDIITKPDLMKHAPNTSSKR